jgi:hypothetical protein
VLSGTEAGADSVGDICRTSDIDVNGERKFGGGTLVVSLILVLKLSLSSALLMASVALMKVVLALMKVLLVLVKMFLGLLSPMVVDVTLDGDRISYEADVCDASRADGKAKAGGNWSTRGYLAPSSAQWACAGITLVTPLVTLLSIP